MTRRPAEANIIVPSGLQTPLPAGEILPRRPSAAPALAPRPLQLTSRECFAVSANLPPQRLFEFLFSGAARQFRIRQERPEGR